MPWSLKLHLKFVIAFTVLYNGLYHISIHKNRPDCRYMSRRKEKKWNSGFWVYVRGMNGCTYLRNVQSVLEWCIKIGRTVDTSRTGKKKNEKKISGFCIYVRGMNGCNYRVLKLKWKKILGHGCRRDSNPVKNFLKHFGPACYSTHLGAPATRSIGTYYNNIYYKTF